MGKSKFYLFLGLSLLAFSLIWIFLTFYTIKANGLSANSPRTIPFFLGICMSILSIVFLYQYYLGFRPKDLSQGLKKNEIKNFFSIILFLILYTLFLEWFGFVLSTPIFIFLLSRFLLHEKNWLVNYLLPILLTSIIYFVFVILLHSNLPRGTIIRLF
jgi:putative tricarboxylic transport membrane protein